MSTERNKFRISATSLFLTYPEEKDYTSIKEDDIKDKLTEELDSYEIKTLIIARETSDSENPYNHFHVFVKTEKKMNITSQDRLDIKGIHGNYQAAKNHKNATNYLLKQGDVTGFGFDQHKIITEQLKDPFDIFCYRCKYQGKNPRELMNKILDSEKYNTEFFNIEKDYWKRINIYENYILKNTKNKKKPLNQMYIRQDIALGLMNWIDESDNNSWTSKTLYLWGESGCGKSSLARSITKDEALIVRDLNQLKNYRPKTHNSIIFDDVCLKNRDREEIISLLEGDTSRVVNVKFGTVSINPGVTVIFISNYNPIRTLCENVEDKAILRRIHTIEVKTYCEKHIKIPPICWDNWNSDIKIDDNDFLSINDIIHFLDDIKANNPENT